GQSGAELGLDGSKTDGHGGSVAAAPALGTPASDRRRAWLAWAGVRRRPRLMPALADAWACCMRECT
ncbi:MAG: hypothetical protein ACK4MX_09395, partial [Thermaurantiacus sp.]